MAYIRFSSWIEGVETRRRVGIGTVILDFLKSQIKIHDDESLLQLNTKDIDSGVISDMLSRGIIKHDPNLVDIIKNGITIQELIQYLARSA
jgi:hypothetical protein